MQLNEDYCDIYHIIIGKMYYVKLVTIVRKKCFSDKLTKELLFKYIAYLTNIIQGWILHCIASYDSPAGYSVPIGWEETGLHPTCKCQFLVGTLRIRLSY